MNDYPPFDRLPPGFVEIPLSRAVQLGIISSSGHDALTGWLKVYPERAKDIILASACRIAVHETNPVLNGMTARGWRTGRALTFAAAHPTASNDASTSHDDREAIETFEDAQMDTRGGA